MGELKVSEVLCFYLFIFLYHWPAIHLYLFTFKNVHKFSSYYSEAISHKMARIGSPFKLTAIYLEQKGKLLSPNEARGNGRKMQLLSKKEYLIAFVIWRVQAENCQPGCLCGSVPPWRGHGGWGARVAAPCHRKAT